jgi:hypothetical protein
LRTLLLDFSNRHSLARLKRHRDSYPSNESHDSRGFIAKAAVGQPWLSLKIKCSRQNDKIIPHFQFFHHHQRFQIHSVTGLASSAA